MNFLGQKEKTRSQGILINLSAIKAKWLDPLPIRSLMDPVMSHLMDPEMSPLTDPEMSPLMDPEMSPLMDPEMSPIMDPRSG